jgi:hypothetical protein
MACSARCEYLFDASAPAEFNFPTYREQRLFYACSRYPDELADRKRQAPNEAGLQAGAIYCPM